MVIIRQELMNVFNGLVRLCITIKNHDIFICLKCIKYINIWLKYNINFVYHFLVFLVFVSLFY